MTTLTMKDEKRLDVIQRVYRSELKVIEAAQILNISERQFYRVKARVKNAGTEGMVHGNCGRSCRRTLKGKTLKQSLELVRKTEMVIGHVERHGAIPTIASKMYLQRLN